MDYRRSRSTFATMIRSFMSWTNGETVGQGQILSVSSPLLSVDWLNRTVYALSQAYSVYFVKSYANCIGDTNKKQETNNYRIFIICLLKIQKKNIFAFPAIIYLYIDSIVCFCDINKVNE